MLAPKTHLNVVEHAGVVAFEPQVSEGQGDDLVGRGSDGPGAVDIARVIVGIVGRLDHSRPTRVRVERLTTDGIGWK